MEKISRSVLAKALSGMHGELAAMQKKAEDFQTELDDVDPDSLTLELDGEVGEMLPTDDPMKEEGEGAKEELKIETPADAKKALEEAKKDIQQVVDNLDALCGQAEEETEALAAKRINDNYRKSLSTLKTQAEKGIMDAGDAIRYWSKLPKLTAKKSSKSSSKPGKVATKFTLADTLEVVKSAKSLFSELTNIFSDKKVTATAVPPTGAEFSGDKWPEGKNVAEVENRAWQAGVAKYKKDKSFETGKENAADTTRLNMVDYNRDDSPYVNASFHSIPDNKYGSYWKIQDSKTGKEAKVSFAGAPASLGRKDDQGFKAFSSPGYGKQIANAVIQDGIDSVAAQLNGNLARISKIAASDKSTVRRYYADAYGDANYAKKMTQGGEKGDNMDTEYVPKDKHVKDKSTETKDGTGKISNEKEDIEVIKAKARKAIGLAKKFASRGAIPFTKTAIHQKASEFMAMSTEVFAAQEAAISLAPIVNEAALKSAHIPDTEQGIVGNQATGVSDPAGKVKTEGMDGNVSSDAKVTTASVVPQMSGQSAEGLNISSAFSTVSNRLKAIGVTPDKLRVARYRS